LSGDGRGGFRVVPAEESGIYIYGEQRGAAVADFDRDGRMDLAVSQNGAQTRLYRNDGTNRPGLRVYLGGSASNPHAIGAVARPVMEGAKGAAVEVHGGSGYWSHDSVVCLLTARTPISGVWVRWPGGKETTSKIPQGATEVRLDTNGNVSVRE
jgi:hypothetical protein